jgi:hypothetical protein
MATQIDPTKLAERLRTQGHRGEPPTSEERLLRLLAEAVEHDPAPWNQHFLVWRKDWLRRVAEATGGEEHANGDD